MCRYEDVNNAPSTIPDPGVSPVSHLNYDLHDQFHLDSHSHCRPHNYAGSHMIAATIYPYHQRCPMSYLDPYHNALHLYFPSISAHLSSSILRPSYPPTLPIPNHLYVSPSRTFSPLCQAKVLDSGMVSSRAWAAPRRQVQPRPTREPQPNAAGTVALVVLGYCYVGDGGGVDGDGSCINLLMKCSCWYHCC